jgi:cation diffusion facilitator family transporter
VNATHHHHDADPGSGGHPHDHRSHRRGGLSGAVGEVFRPHSHDAADSIDAALEASQQGLRAVVISFAALMVTAFVQVVPILATGSAALLADTIHNFSDALTAVPLFVAFRLSRRPPTRRYTYGYKRAEDLAGVFVIAMIALSAIIAAYEAIDRLIHPRPLTNIGWLLVAGLLGFAGNELVALYRIRVGRQIGSAALTADGYHARTDGFTSLAVALGAVGAWLGFERADPIVGLIIAVSIFVVLRNAARQIFHRLMDAVDPEIIGAIEHSAEHVDGVQRVGSVQARWVGHRLTASIAVAVDEDLSVRQGHDVAEAVRHDLLHSVRHLDRVDVHIDPCGHHGNGADGHVRRHHDPHVTDDSTHAPSPTKPASVAQEAR